MEKKHAMFLVMALAMVMILCGSVTAAEIPTNTNVNLTVANDAGARFDDFGNESYNFFSNQSTGQGLNTLKIASSNSSSDGNVVFTDSQSSTFYIFDTGSVGWIDNGILMLAVNGTIPDDFNVTITSSGYVWTPVAKNKYPLPEDLTYETHTETFTKNDFTYGPQDWKPSTVTDYPIFEGQNMSDVLNNFNIMFIDLYVGSIGTSTLSKPEYAGITLINNGNIKVIYTFQNLDNLAAFNAYAYRVYSTTGTGVKWTNALNTDEQNETGVSGYYVTTPDVTKPVISAIDPTNNAVNVPINKTITLTFNEEVKPGSMWIELLTPTGTIIPTTVDGSFDTLTIDPNSALTKATKYTLAIHTGSVTDMAGNPIKGIVYYFTTDSTAPTVATIDPTNNAVNVPVNKTITLTFNEEVKAGSMWIELLTPTGTIIPTTISGSGNTLTIDPNSALTKATKYTLAIHTGSVTDMAGNPIKGIVYYFTTDSTAPTVATIDPTNNAVNVPVNKTITLTFNEEVKAGSMWIELLTPTGTIIPTTISGSGNTLTIDPNSALTKATKYTLAIHTGSVTDMAGNPIKGIVYYFTTDSTAPTVATIIPTNNAVGVPVDTNITVQFNEEVKAGTLWIELLNPAWTPIPINITGSYDTLNITLNNVTLDFGTKYALAIHTGSVTDMAGNPVKGIVYYFTTQNPT